MDAGLLIAIALALAFSLTNGFHDAANAIATLVATRGATPGAGDRDLLGLQPPRGGRARHRGRGHDRQDRRRCPPTSRSRPIGAGLAGATAWNLLTWWRGLPSSSGHALVGGLVGAALAEGGWGAVNLGGFDGWHPVGAHRDARRAARLPGDRLRLRLRPAARACACVTRRFTRQWAPTLVGGRVGHGRRAELQPRLQRRAEVDGRHRGAAARDRRDARSFTVPLWVKLATGLAVTLGTALGGWRIVKTIGRRIFSLKPLDSLASQSSSTAVIFGASLIGAPVSTTQVVASSVVGVGGGRRRWRHVRWGTVREIGIAWLTTIPAAGVLAVVVLYIWKGVAAL